MGEPHEKTSFLTKTNSDTKCNQPHFEPEMAQRAAATLSSETQEDPAKSKSVGIQLNVMGTDLSQRRLSQGDDPLWLGKANERENNLLHRSNSCNRKIRMTEVAPLHSFLREDESSGWKIPLELFSSKKQVNMDNTSKRARSYYKAQDELITAYEDINQKNEADPESLDTQNNYKKAIFYSKVTLCVNLLLLAAKAVASALSGSIAIISSLVDTSLDLFSGVIMWWATRAVKKRDPYHYPQGRTKLEPVAVIILSVVMGLCSIQLIRESIQTIVELSIGKPPLPNVDYITFTIAGSTVIIKLVLWIICRRVQTPVVQALAQDHRNDVLSNTVAIICGYLGSKNFESGIYEFAYTDPVGAILISFYIIFNWWHTGSEQIKMLTGHTARPDFLSKITWICLNHHSQILQIDTVRAFHFGSNFLVEVDIILPDNMILREAHDIGEGLQHRLESLPEVERAFVHVDFDSTHNPHHEHKQV